MATPQEENTHKNFKYHHGNLRDALIQAALNILQTETIDKLSLRKLAKATGVTQAAPYSHFRDKDELLAAIAETGFRQLAVSMADAAAGVRDPAARVEKLMTSYVHFALKNKTLFRLMFARELADLKKFPTLGMTAGKSYALISAALSTRQDQQVDTGFMTVTIWSLCQGLSSLLIDDKLDISHYGTEDIDSFIKKIIGVFADKLA